MKKTLLLFIAISLVIQSCAVSKPIAPVNTEPVVIESPLSKEEVWEKLIDYLALNGTTIKILDKSSGLMITEPYSFINSYTITDSNGKPKASNLYCV